MDDKQVEAVARAILDAAGSYERDAQISGEIVCAQAAINAYHTSTNNREQRMREALEPFARLRLSTEGEISDLVYRTPAEDARRRARAIEDQDAEILAARTALEE